MDDRHFVRALADGVWDVANDAYNPNVIQYPRYLVRALVNDVTWNVNRAPVEVEAGLVLGFQRQEDAEYFLNGHHPRKEHPRAEMVHVAKDMIVCFYAERDAQWAMASGKAVGMSEAEVIAAMEAVQAAAQSQAAAATEPGSEAEPVTEADPTPVVTQSKPKGKKGK